MTAALGDFESIFSALARRDVKYLVVGGVAVVLHGYPRFTADLDLVLALEKPNVQQAMAALKELGYAPRAPVPAEHFAEPEMRRQWIEEKGLTVFSLWSPRHPATEVDIFTSEPFVFQDAYARAVRAEIGRIEVTVASVADLIELKRQAGRPKDAQDILALEALLANNEADGAE